MHMYVHVIHKPFEPWIPLAAPAFLGACPHVQNQTSTSDGSHVTLATHQRQFVVPCVSHSTVGHDVIIHFCVLYDCFWP